jgi:predicted aspartyl protease
MLISLEGAGVDLKAKPVQFMGAAGPVDVIPVHIEKISLGDAVEKGVRGNCWEQQPLSKMLGLEVAGTISHEFFKHYSVTFDFSEMKAYLKR